MTVRYDFSDYYGSAAGGFWFRWLDWQKVALAVRELRDLPPGARLLDLGCGTGYLSARIGRALGSLELHGADINEELLSMAEANGLRVLRADFDTELPYEQGFFDVVLMIDTLEHVRSRERTFREVKRVLTDAGRMLVFTPPYDSAAWNLGEAAFRLLLRRDGLDHVSPFTREALAFHLRTHFRTWRVVRTNFGLTMYGVGREKLP